MVALGFGHTVAMLDDVLNAAREQLRRVAGELDLPEPLRAREQTRPLEELQAELDSLVEQHRLVYDALAEPLADGTIHELRISTQGGA